MQDQEDDAIWGEILQEAVRIGSAGRDVAVTGARLKQSLGAVALKKGLQYPPEKFLQSKFKVFLDYFVKRGDIVIRERDGQDLLIAPSDRAGLVFSVPSGHGSHSGTIRRDIFDAFTKVSKQQVWYNRLNDRIFTGEIEVNEDDSGWIRIPSVTLEQAIDDRNKFSASLNDANQEKKLKKDLDNLPLHPLVTFSENVRSLGLQSKWHRFRLNLVAGRIADWAKGNNIPWNPSWVTSSNDGRVMDSTPGEVRDPQREWQKSLAHFIGRLDQADLARISVPLDIVVRCFLPTR